MTNYSESFFMGNRDTSYLGDFEEQNKYQEDDYVCHIEDPNDSHSSIARRVRESSKVLDIGCATGIIGKLLKENKDCVVTGIEYDEVSYKIALESGNYQTVYNFSITDYKNKLYRKFLKNKSKYDYIILADVLEHIDDPLKIIDIFKDKLKSNGKFLISVPNIAHIDIIKGLINKKFDYNNVGILDSTHLRFFTATSFVEMIQNYNKLHNEYFSVEYFDSTYVIPDYVCKKGLYKYLNDNDYNIVQNIFELTKVGSKDKVEYINIPKKENVFEDINNKIENLENRIKELEIENKKLQDRKQW